MSKTENEKRLTRLVRYRTNATLRAARLIQCVDCGATTTLVLHHIAPDAKTTKMNNCVKNYHQSTMTKELDKCMPLCRKCHARLHGILNKDIKEDLISELCTVTKELRQILDGNKNKSK